jgi:hypothetical protein
VTVFTAPSLTVEAGLSEIILRAARVDNARHVRDGSGAVLAVVRRSPGDTGAWYRLKQTFGWLLPLAEPRRTWDVEDPAGARLLRLYAVGRQLSVAGPAGEELAVARNSSRLTGPPDVRVDVHLMGTKGPVAWFTGPADQDTFDYQVVDGTGVIGRVSRGGSGTPYALSLDPRVDGTLRTVLVAVACGLVDRPWWRLPQRGSGGD